MEITVDAETLKLIASAAAEAAVKEVAAKVQEETRQEFARMQATMTKQLDTYFGKLDPANHVIQHDRMNRFLTMVDRMGEGLFASILKNIVWGLIVASVVGWVFWQKFTGGAG